MVRHRCLAQELRRLREAAHLTCEQVGAALDVSASKISRIETGRVSPRDVRDLLKIYRVPDDQRDSLIQLARDARQKGWWHAYADGLRPTWAWKALLRICAFTKPAGSTACCRPLTTAAPFSPRPGSGFSGLAQLTNRHES
jgi:transcriptional regulator with XRE-family HTH domain